MVNIELTQQQADELKDFYAIELEKIQRRTDEIKGLLNKLGTGPLDISKPVTSLTKVRLDTIVTDQQQKESVESMTGKTKNLKWSNYIIKVLKEQNKPMTIKQIIKSFEKQNDIDLSSSNDPFYAVTQALNRLRVKNNLIYNKRIKGKRDRLFGLVEWNDKSDSVTKTAKAKKIEPIKKVNQKSETIIDLDKKRPLNVPYNWPKFIFETLTKTKRVLSAKDLLKYAMVFYNLPKIEMATIRVKLAAALSRQEKIVKSLRTCKKDNQVGRFFGLPDWFDGNNKLIVDYK